jgi:hypothetical protein
MWNRTTTMGSSAKMKPFALTAVALVPLVVGALIGGWALPVGILISAVLGRVLGAGADADAYEDAG